MKAGTQSFRAVQRVLVAERQAKIAELYLGGRTQVQIARELDLSTYTISTDLGAIIALWQKQATVDLAAHFAVELKKINQTEADARESFEKSKKVKRVASVTKRSNLTGEETVSSATQIEREEGDPRFLAIITKCTDQRMRLLGLDKWKTSDDAENKPPLVFSQVVAAHLKQRERNVNGTTPKSLPQAVRLDPARLK